VPKVPFEVFELVMTGAGGRMVKARFWEAVPALFEAERVTVALPTAVGMPEILPLVAFNVSPFGRLEVP
jgi:hypothetical protein